MTTSEKYLTPYSLYGEKTFEDYCTKIPEFYFRKKVPEDVIKNFEIIERLMAFSYYEYRFIDEAFAKALFTFEMAMGMRLKDFDPKSKKDRFQALITKLTNYNAFDTDLKILRHVKDMRDYYSHPERHSFGGIVFWNRIEFINRLINEMYEDINTRLARRKATNFFVKELLNSNLDKFSILEIEEKIILLYKTQLLLLNNKIEPNTYLFACTPLFNYKSDENGATYVPNSIPILIINPIFKDNTLNGQCFYTKKTISFLHIEKLTQFVPIWEEWKNGYNKIENQFLFESSINSGIPEIFIPAVQEFQKM